MQSQARVAEEYRSQARVAEEYRFPCQDGGVRSVRLYDWDGSYQVCDGVEVVGSFDDAFEARRCYCDVVARHYAEWEQQQ